MLKVKVYNSKGEKTGEQELNSAVFGVEIKSSLLHRVVVSQLANKRKAIADTKNRGERRGGGIKPWKQKGTGRARAGSIRSPLWKKGGVIFGPTEDRVFTKKLNKKEKRKALFMALSAKLSDNLLVVVDKFQMSKIRTKDIVNFLSSLSLKGKSTLIILPQPNKEVEKSSANLPQVKVLLVDSLNIMDVLKYDNLLISAEALKKIEKIYLSTKSFSKEVHK